MIKGAFIFGLCCVFGFAVPSPSKTSAGPQQRARITGGIDEGSMVTLRGNTRPEATAANDRGKVFDSFRLEHLFLQLRRPPEQERELEEFLDQLHDRLSPNFHHWLTAQEFGKRFGLPEEEITIIARWLESQGFAVNLVYPNGVLIDFSGTAGQIQRAFHTEIHYLEVAGKKHIANMSDPQIPAALAPAVVGIVSLNDFMPHPMHQRRAEFTTASGYYLVVPQDLATIYNFNPIFAGGFSGQGQTIVVVEDTDVFTTADWSTFRSVLGLGGYTSGSFTQSHPAPPSGPNNCSDPGVNGDDDEAILDAEWASAGAPNAAIVLISCTDTTNFGGFIALQNLLNASSMPPAIVSISYGDSETDDGATYNAAISSMYEQAVGEGVSVFVSAGDQAAASSDPGAVAASHGINVSGWASTIYNVAVGGTDFGDSFAGTNSTYWNATNTPAYGSALSYVPEIPWNDTCASVLIATSYGFGVTYGVDGFCNDTVNGVYFLDVVGGSGGPSGCATGAPATPDVVSGTCAGYSKPSWQSVFGNPHDGVRDLPDVSLFAADGIWGHYYVACFSDVSNGGAPCTGTPDNWSGYGGTSISSPIMASIQALMNQASGSRLGNPNLIYYPLAAAEYGATGNASCNSTLGNAVASTCIFYDVTQGDMDAPCTGSFNCYLPSGTYGVLSTSKTAYQPAYATTPGWDFATGIGTVNAYNLVVTMASGVASVSSASLGFAPQPINTASAAKSAMLINSGLGSLTFNNATIAGANSGDFNLSQSCPSSLSGGANCMLSVTFKPTAGGPRKSSISISTNAAGSPTTIILTGVGTAAGLSPTSLPFSGQTVGTSSAPQMITLTNQGSVTMNLWEIAILGTNAGDFNISANTCGSTLTAGANCTVSVTFKPTATGARSAALLFSDDGGGSPQSVPLMGTGQ